MPLSSCFFSLRECSGFLLSSLNCSFLLVQQHLPVRAHKTGLSPVSCSPPYSHSDVLPVALFTSGVMELLWDFCVFVSLIFVPVSPYPPRVSCDSQWIQMHEACGRPSVYKPLNLQSCPDVTYCPFDSGLISNNSLAQL